MTTNITIKTLSVQYHSRDPDRENIRGQLLKLISPKKKTSINLVNKVFALNNLTLQINKGERVGLVGINGSGKTTLLKIIAKILYPTSGSIDITGNVSAIFDPSLGMDPEASGFENIRIRCMLLGVSGVNIDEKVDYISNFSELGEALYRPIKTYSSGMAMRLAFSIATSVNPEILVMDEWLSAGDARFVSKALDKMQELIRASQILVLASHSETVLIDWCNRLLWIKDGKIAEDGEPADVLSKYRHFTKTV